VRANDDRQALTAPMLAGLLARLHADPGQAGLEYEHLRRSLIRFFDWRGEASAQECADECLDRLARRLADEAAILDVRRYALGIARLVLLERRRHRVTVSLSQLPEPRLPATATSESADEDASALHDCFDRCLSELAADSQALLVRYYEGERDRKIANRRELAMSMGLSDNALRSRVQRLRDRLEACVQSCLGTADRKTS
jgi:DNA-directed RNA polymerase specialized sigma24 family protein